MCIMAASKLSPGQVKTKAAELIQQCDAHSTVVGEVFHVVSAKWFKRLQDVSDGSTSQLPGPVDCESDIVRRACRLHQMLVKAFAF